MIYFAQLKNTTIRIGATEDVDRRINALQSRYGKPVSLLATMPGGPDEEKAIRERFAHLRHEQTEQYYLDVELMDFIGLPPPPGYVRVGNRLEMTEEGRAMWRRRRRKAEERRRREQMRGGRFTREDWEIALEFFGHCCAFCSGEGPLQREHFFPLGYDGPHAAGNIVPACGLCNESKGTRDPRSWCTPDVYRRIVDFLATRPCYPGEIDRIRVVFRGGLTREAGETDERARGE